MYNQKTRIINDITFCYEQQVANKTVKAEHIYQN